MDTDGVQKGFDAEMLKSITSKLTIPVIASGGVGKLEHFYKGHQTRSTGLLAASVFHSGKYTIKKVKRFLDNERSSCQTMIYDKENIFAKILKGEIPCDKIYEDEYILSFKDINPQAKTHVLIIPKDPYIDVADFLQNADTQYQTYFLGVCK